MWNNNQILGNFSYWIAPSSWNEQWKQNSTEHVSHKIKLKNNITVNRYVKFRKIKTAVKCQIVPPAYHSIPFTFHSVTFLQREIRRIWQILFLLYFTDKKNLKKVSKIIFHVKMKRAGLFTPFWGRDKIPVFFFWKNCKLQSHVDGTNDFQNKK